MTLWHLILFSKQQMVLSPDSYSYDMWKELPMPMYMSLYFFNVTNSDDIENRVPGVKPKLEEVGPYIYRQYQFMNVSSWNDDNDTVTYMQNKYWTFQPKMSQGTLDDIIVSINVIALVGLLLSTYVYLSTLFRKSASIDTYLVLLLF